MPLNPIDPYYNTRVENLKEYMKYYDNINNINKDLYKLHEVINTHLFSYFIFNKDKFYVCECGKIGTASKYGILWFETPITDLNLQYDLMYMFSNSNTFFSRVDSSLSPAVTKVSIP